MTHGEFCGGNAGNALTDHGIRVLLVDDQETIGDRVRHILSREKDIAYHYCGESARAVAMAAEVAPTVILQDLFMPGIDGLTLIDSYRANPATCNIPLIVLSNEEDPVTKAEAFSRGANDYLVKLPDRIELIARLRYHSGAYINLLQRNEAYSALEASRKALTDELAKAAQYVRSMLPTRLDGEVKTDWRFIPSMQLGGDSFNYHWIDSDNLAIYLLDVSGHGIDATLLSVSVINILRAQTLPGVDFRRPSQVLRKLNAAFQMEYHNELFFSIWYGVYVKSARKLICCSGGHPPAVLVSGRSIEDTSILKVTSRNPMIGMERDSEYKEIALYVDKDTRLYVFSDGIYEIMMPDGSHWTHYEFVETLKQPVTGDISILDRVLAYSRSLMGSDEFNDDVSLLEIQFCH
jgi:phosphoserine phosphatase RsbU/P